MVDFTIVFTKERKITEAFFSVGLSSFPLILLYIYIYIYILSSSDQTKDLVVSQLRSKDRHARCFKLGLKSGSVAYLT